MKRVLITFCALLLAAMASAQTFAAEQTTREGYILGGKPYRWELNRGGMQPLGPTQSQIAAPFQFKTSYSTPDAGFGALLEAAPSQQPQSDRLDTGLGRSYAWVKLSGHTVQAGRDTLWANSYQYSPRQFLDFSNDHKQLLNRWGYLDGGVDTLVRWRWQRGGYGLSVSGARPQAQAPPTLPSGAELGSEAPTFDLAFHVESAGFMTTPSLGFGRVAYHGGQTGDGELTSWVMLVPMKLSVGRFTTKFQVHYGANLDLAWQGGYSRAIGDQPAALPVFLDDGSVVDTTQFGGFLALEWRLGPLETTVGGGYVRVQNQAWRDLGYKYDAYGRWAALLAATYYVNPYLGIHPEFTYYNYGLNPRDGQEAGNEWLLGLQFQFSF